MPRLLPVVRVFFTLILIQQTFFPAVARLSASLDYYVFPAEKGGRILFLLGVEGAGLQYRRLPAGIQGTTAMTLVINDSTRNFVADRTDFNTPVLTDSLQRFQVFASSRLVALPPGKYQADIILFDALSADTARERISFGFVVPDVAAAGGLSDLILLESSGLKTGLPVLQQPTGAFRTSDFFARNDTLLSFYGETYGMTHLLAAGMPFISRIRVLDQNSGKSYDEYGRLKRSISGALPFLRMDINIRDLPSGNYSLVWDLIDSSGRILTRSLRPFKRSNQGVERETSPAETGAVQAELLATTLEEARHLTASLLPVCTRSEQATIEYLRKKGTRDEIARYQQEFWERRDKSNPRKPFQTYRERIQLADSRYGTQTMKGYQTERGRVYLQYGKPDIIENEYSDRNRKAMQNLNTVPYEVWYYYTIESPVRQNDVMFVFVQQNRGNANYRLIHSSCIGEVRNTEWRKWVETNATYNWDRLDPNDRGEIQNPRMAR